MIVGILGFAGVGKDTVADVIVKHGAQKVAFADELKRIVMNLFDFTPEQMWGVDEIKETPDTRYQRPHHTWDVAEMKCACCNLPWGDFVGFGTPCYLTPRYALQIMGTEGGRQCYSSIWVRRGLHAAKQIELGFRYTQLGGVEYLSGEGLWPKIAVFTDNRFINEVEGIQAAGGKVFRVKRPGFEKPRFNHASETEQLSIPDDKLQGVINNDGTLEDLEKKVLELIKE